MHVRTNTRTHMYVRILRLCKLANPYTYAYPSVPRSLLSRTVKITRTSTGKHYSVRVALASMTSQRINVVDCVLDVNKRARAKRVLLLSPFAFRRVPTPRAPHPPKPIPVTLSLFLSYSASLFAVFFSRVSSGLLQTTSHKMCVGAYTTAARVGPEKFRRSPVFLDRPVSVPRAKLS